MSKLSFTDPGQFEEKARHSMSRSGFGYNDHYNPDDGTIDDADLKQQKYQYAQKDWELQQAQAQGVISSEEYAAAKDTDHSNWFEKLTGQKNDENTGSLWESFGDVLLMPNHFIAATAFGATKGAIDNTSNVSWLPSVGFSTGAFRDAWRNKKGFTQLFDQYGVFNNNYAGVNEDTANFAAGFAADLALDPTSYLTLGTSKGAQVTVSSTTRAKAGLAYTGEKLTQTPFGKAMFDFTANKLSKKFSTMALEKGGLDGRLVAEQYAEVTDHLISNFPSLQKEYLQKVSAGSKWARTKAVIAPAGEAARATLANLSSSRLKKLAGYGMEDMFQETSSFFTKERGIYDMNKAQRFLAKSTPSIVAKPMEWAFDTFDKGWQAPAEVNDMIQLMQVTTGQMMEKKTHAFQSIFAKANMLTEESRAELVTAVEKRAGGVYEAMTPEFEEAMTSYQKHMDEIIESEVARGYPTESVEGYVSHMPNPNVRRMYQKLMDRNGAEVINSTNKYVKQRVIASIADGEDIYGKGAFITDPLEILKRRQRASIDMMAKGDLFKFIMEKHSLPVAIIHASFKGNAAKNVMVGMLRRSVDGVHEIMNVDQVYQAVNGNLSKLGFKEGDLAHNRELLSFLSKPTTERVAGQGVFNDAAKFHYNVGADGANAAIPEHFTFTPAKLKSVTGNAPEVTEHTFPVDTMMKMLADPRHQGWKAIFKDSVGGTEGNINRVIGLINGFHNFTMKHLDSQLVGFIPDLEKRVTAAYQIAAHENGWKEKLSKRLSKTISGMSAGFEFRDLVPQLPESLVALGHASRRMIGNIVDTAEVTESTMKQLDKVYAELGFTPETIKQAQEITLGHENGVQFQSDVDRILDWLEPYTYKQPTVDMNGKLIDASKAAADRRSAVYDPRFRDRIVKWTFTSTRKVVDNFLPEINDLEQGITAGEGGLDGKSPAGKELAKDRGEFRMNGEVPPQDMRLVDALESSTTRVPHVTEAGANATKGHGGALDFINDRRAAINEQIKGHDAALSQKQNLKSLIARRGPALAEQKAARVEQLAAAKGSAEHKALLERSKQARAVVKSLRADISAAKVKVKELTPAGATREELLKESKDLNKAQRDHIAKLKASRQPSTEGVTSSGILAEPDVVDKLTPADRVMRLRQQLGADPENVGLRAQLESAKEDLHRLAGGEVPPPVQTGLNRISNKTVTHEVYLPEGVAKVLKDLEAPGLPEGMSDAARSMVERFDTFQNYMKLNMTLPFAGYYGRNGIQNAILTGMRTGTAFLDPTNNFEAGSNMVAATMHSLLKYGEGDKLFGWSMPRATKYLQGLGERIVTSKTGRKWTLKELDEQMSMRGIHHGMQTSEMFGKMPIATRFKGALNGAMAGAVLGSSTGALAGPTDSNSADYGALLGVLAGAAVGHGIPVRGLKGTTGMLQADWKPLIRPGEAATEMPFRVGLFMHEIMQHGNPSEAADQVYRHMNNYHSMSVFERRWLRRIVPFYSWSKNAMRHSFFQTVEDPGKIANVFKFFNDWNSSAHVDPEDMSDALHEKLTLSTKNSSLFAKAKDWEVVGKFLSPGERNITGFGTAEEDAIAMISGALPGDSKDSQQFLRNIASRGSFPLIDAAQVLVQKDFYTGKDEPLTRPNVDEWAGTPDWIKKVVGYNPSKPGVKGASIDNPTTAWILNKMPHARFIGLLKTVYEMDGEQRKGLDTWQLSKNFLGVSAYKSDPTSGKFYINKGRIDALSNLLERIADVDSGSAPNMGRYRQSKKSGRLTF